MKQQLLPPVQAITMTNEKKMHSSSDKEDQN